MDYQQIAVAFHLIGFALGLGGATISDVTFFKALRTSSLTSEQYSFLKSLSRIIWMGLALLIVSGLVIFTLIYAEQGSLTLLASPRWQAKLTLVGIVLLNGLIFKFSIFPTLGRLVGQRLGLENIRPIIWKLAVSGTVSILSWYSILVITLLPRTFKPPLFYFIGVYLILLIIGIFVSKTLIHKITAKGSV